MIVFRLSLLKIFKFYEKYSCFFYYCPIIFITSKYRPFGYELPERYLLLIAKHHPINFADIWTIQKKAIRSFLQIAFFIFP